MSLRASFSTLWAFRSKQTPKNPVYAMPRASLLGLMVTMVACFLPHVERLPVWMWAMAAGCVIYRYLILAQRLNFPGSVFKFAVAALGTTLLLREYGTLMSPDGGVAFLLLGYFLKMLEMQYRRDATVLMLLSFFVIPMQFLYQTGFLPTLWVLLCFLLILATLVSFHQQNEGVFPPRAYATGVRLMAYALPLTVILFLFFPRLPPFWNLPTTKPTQTIGLTDQLDMQNLGELFRSGKVAFRAEFPESNPERRQLYWRGVVMERFDGNSWSVRENAVKIPVPGQAAFDSLDYRVYLEPTQQRYVFFLSPLAFMSGVTAERRENDMIMADKPIVSKMVYHAGTGVDAGLAQYSSERNLQDNLILPAFAAPRTRSHAEALFENAKRDPEAFVQAINAWIFSEAFSYTLSPPSTRGDVVDDFLFRTRSGYCSHYASAAAVMLRTVGIPARVVGGYQGGEYHAAGNYWIIHQYDAHAWVEYFHPQKGWITFDPTAAISPLRIENGMEQMSGAGAGGMFESYAMNQWPILRQLRLGMDYLNYQWIINVVGYQQDDRNQMFDAWFGGTELKDWLPDIAIILVSLLSLGWFYLWWRDRPSRLHPLDEIMLSVLRRVNRRFRDRRVGETVADYCKAYAAEGGHNAEHLLALCERYHRLRFQHDFGASNTVAAKTDTGGNGRLRSTLAEFRRAAKHFQ